MKFETANGPISVNIADWSSLSALILDKTSKNQSFAVATLNLDHLAKMNHDQRFYEAYQIQDCVVADGNPIVWLSNIARAPLDLLPGSDLIEPICELAVSKNLPVAMLGSTPLALDLAEKSLTAEFPELNIVAKISPEFGFDPASDTAAAALAEIKDSGARLCFIALGAPKQEVLAARGRDLVPHTGFISIGAGLDFLAGTQTRAPVWVRAIAMEWLWRLLQQPKRMTARYAHCFAILPGHLRRALKTRAG